MKPGLTSGYKQEIRRSLDFYQEKGGSFNTQTGLEKQQELPEELPRGLDKRNAECLGRAGLEKATFPISSGFIYLIYNLATC